MSDYFDSGFSVREPMWHGKGEVKDRPPKDWAEAREWAGLQWDPVSVPIAKVDVAALEKAQALVKTLKKGDTLRPVDLKVLKDGVAASDLIKGFKGVERNDTGSLLTVRSQSYQVIDHLALGEIIEAILDQSGVEYVTAGAARGGKEVWALAYLDEPVTIPGDNSITLPFLAVTARHDGKGSCKANSTSVKIVCHNTFTASEAQGERNGTIFTFPHTGDYRDRLQEAQETIKGLRRDFASYVGTATDLLAVHVTKEQTERFVTEFIPMPPESIVSDRVVANVEEARKTLRLILDGPTSDGIGDSAWGLVQAAGEYLDHYRIARSMDSKYRRTLLKGEPLKARATNMVRELVKV